MSRASSAVRSLIFIVLMALTAGAWADGPQYDFKAPATVAGPTTPGVMRDLAERILPVYQNPDPDRYLANVAALQMVAGDYSSADVTRQSLRDRRRHAIRVHQGLNIAAHDHHPFQLAESGRILIDHRADIGQRPDGDQGDLAGIFARLVQDEIHRRRMRSARERAALGIAALGEGAQIDIGGRAHGDGNVAAAQLAQHAVEHFRARRRVAEACRHADNVELRTGQRQPQGKRVVDIIADIAIDDDFLGRLRL